MSKSIVCCLKIGEFVSFLYPSHNYRGLRQDMERRRARVLAIRDTRLEPVPKEWIDARPTLNRGRWLVICEDLDKGEQRQFYWERMREVVEISEGSVNQIQDAEYCVVKFDRVQFASNDPATVAAFRMGAGSGQICSVVREKIG